MLQVCECFFFAEQHIKNNYIIYIELQKKAGLPYLTQPIAFREITDIRNLRKRIHIAVKRFSRFCNKSNKIGSQCSLSFDNFHGFHIFISLLFILKSIDFLFIWS